MPDVLIRGGIVYDGSGKPPLEADVLVSGAAILDVITRHSPEQPSADCVIDAAGRIVTPGFIDVHSHSDMNLFVAPDCDSKLFQGITTEIVGNCGMSAFPPLDRMDDEISLLYARAGHAPDWRDAQGYFSKVDEARPALNYASFVGHGNVRAQIMGYDDRPPDTGELRAMQKIVEESVEAGALGFSTGLIYTPGMFADTDEIIALQQAAARNGGIYASHVRGEGDRLTTASEEFMRVIRAVDCQGQYSHLKASGRRNWGQVPQIIEQIEKLNDAGGFVRFDKYPYVASGTDLASLLPRWVHNGGRDAAVARLQDAKQRARVIRELVDDYGKFSPWAGVLIVDSGAPEFAQYNGKTVEQIAEKTNADPYELFIELLIRSRLTATICNFTMNQDETDLAILHPHGMVCSDGEVRTTAGQLAHGSPHPRSFGSFPRFLRNYVLDTPRLTMEAAIAKITSMPCETFGFAKRGRIEPGYFADILVIDPKTLSDKATFAEPLQYSEGIETVIVNGTITMRDSKPTGRRAGHALRRG